MAEDTKCMINLEAEDQALTARANRRPGDFEALLETTWSPNGELENALELQEVVENLGIKKF